MPSVYAPCPTCRGSRFHESTLKMLFLGKNIAEVLDLSVDQACEFFAEFPIIPSSLAIVAGYRLGVSQARTTSH
jgi:excinuclease ABC subunit A